jgi:hypothetical protein
MHINTIYHGHIFSEQGKFHSRIEKLGSISPTYLFTAFTPVAPKNVRIQTSCQYLFTLLGSTGAKAARRTWMKLTANFYISVKPK